MSKLKTDEQLMREFKEGSKEAMEMIYQRYHRKVFNFCLRMLNNRSDAEELTSSVFLTLIEKVSHYDYSRKFSTWIFALARNKVLDRIRRSRRIIPFSVFKRKDTDRNFEETLLSNKIADCDLERQELKELIRQALSCLPLEQRQALILREYNAFSYSDIAQIMDCSLSKVKVLIFRARQNLADKLRPYLEEMVL